MVAKLIKIYSSPHYATWVSVRWSSMTYKVCNSWEMDLNPPAIFFLHIAFTHTEHKTNGL